MAAHTVSGASSAMSAETMLSDSSIRANGMRIRAQRLTYARGGRWEVKGIGEFKTSQGLSESKRPIPTGSYLRRQCVVLRTRRIPQ